MSGGKTKIVKTAKINPRPLAIYPPIDKSKIDPNFLTVSMLSTFMSYLLKIDRQKKTLWNFKESDLNCEITNDGVKNR